jgi:hypothetical protein
MLETPTSIKLKPGDVLHSMEAIIVITILMTMLPIFTLLREQSMELILQSLAPLLQEDYILVQVMA